MHTTTFTELAAELLLSFFFMSSASAIKNPGSVSWMNSYKLQHIAFLSIALTILQKNTVQKVNILLICGLLHHNLMQASADCLIYFVCSLVLLQWHQHRQESDRRGVEKYLKKTVFIRLLPNPPYKCEPILGLIATAPHRQGHRGNILGDIFWQNCVLQFWQSSPCNHITVQQQSPTYIYIRPDYFKGLGLSCHVEQV